MSETKPIYSGEAVLRGRGESDKAGMWVRLELEDAGGVHPFKGYEGERFGVVIVGPLAPAEHAEPVARKGKAGGGPRSDASTAATGHVIHDDGSSSTTIETFRGIRPKRRWQDMPASQRAALLVKENDFREWLKLTADVDWEIDEQYAIAEVRARCGVQSRSEITPGSNAEMQFDAMEGRYQAWRQARGHGVI